MPLNFSRPCGAFVLSLALCAPVAAQQPAEPAGSVFLAGYSVDGMGQDRAVSVFGRVPPDGGSITYIARRQGPEATLNWTSSETCPALPIVLKSLDRLAMPDIGLDSLVYPVGPVEFPGMPGMPTDSPSYSITGLARQPDGSSARVTISALNGLIAGWVQFAEARLAECWSTAEP